MAKYLDKTQEEWDDLVDQWHTDESLTMSLREFLEMDETEYLRLAHGIDTPDLTPEEVREESRKRTAQAVVGLTVQECFGELQSRHHSVNEIIDRIKDTVEIFEQSYSELYDSIKKEHIPQKNHCVIFLGGQPGAGKSYFYAQDDSLDHYIVIDGDKYRKYHPDYKEICENDLENMAERTQSFVNKCVERLIDDLSRDGYNLIIEGTLRDPDVPINTCNFLKSRGYSTELYVVAVDALTSWEATINRAKIEHYTIDNQPNRNKEFDTYAEEAKESNPEFAEQVTSVNSSHENNYVRRKRGR